MEYKVRWCADGEAVIMAESQEEAEELLEDSPLDYLDVDDLLDNFMVE